MNREGGATRWSEKKRNKCTDCTAHSGTNEGAQQSNPHIVALNNFELYVVHLPEMLIESIRITETKTTVPC